MDRQQHTQTHRNTYVHIGKYIRTPTHTVNVADSVISAGGKAVTSTRFGQVVAAAAAQEAETFAHTCSLSSSASSLGSMHSDY